MKTRAFENRFWSFYDLGLGFGKLLGAIGDDHKAVVDVFLVKFVVETREVLLQFANALLAVCQHRQTKRIVAPLSLRPVKSEATMQKLARGRSVY